METEYEFVYPERTPRGSIPIELKVEALAEFYVDRKPIEDVVKAVYDKIGLPAPRNLYQALFDWRGQVTRYLSSGRAPMPLIKLAIDRGLIRKVPPSGDADTPTDTDPPPGTNTPTPTEDP